MLGLLKTSLLATAILFLSAPLFGAAGRNADDTVYGAIKAPNLEDHAAYFAPKAKIAKEDLRKADSLRLKTIKSIKDLLKSKKKRLRRFELLLRLGELYIERHDYIRDVEMASYAKAFDNWLQKDPKKRGKEPTVSFQKSESQMTRAANAFRKLVSEFPKHPRTDAALYSLAKTLARMGKSTAPNYYLQMIKSHPKSPLIPDAYLSLGEYYFDQHKIDDALVFYKKVLQFKTHRVYPYAVYKTGWAYFNATAKDESQQKDFYRRAIAAFKLVVKLSDKDKGHQLRKLDLKQEAIKDLIMVWAETEDVKASWAFFKTIGEKGSFYKMLERLGGIYTEQGKNSQATELYRRILKEAPNRPGNPQIHAKLVELYDQENRVKNVVFELKRMNSRYVGKTPWTEYNKGEPSRVKGAERLVEYNMHRFGTIYHQQGQKTKEPLLTKAAATIYTYYLAAFKNNKNAYDIRYYLAEILFDFKKYSSASEHYMLVAKKDPKGKYHKDAALNSVASIHQLVTDTKFPPLPPLGQAAKPIKIPIEKRKLVARIDQYVKMLPAEKDGQPMRFTAAQTYFEYGHYDEALSRFASITRAIPNSPQAESSVKLIAGYYAQKQDWKNLIAVSRDFIKTKNLLTPQLKAIVLDALRDASFKQALAFEKTNDHKRAANAFVGYQKEFPKDANADRALYNASLSYFKVGDIENALSTGEKILKEYPKSKMRADILATHGQTYESLAKFDQAAAFYQRLAGEFPADKRSPGALFNSAILYKGLKKYTVAINLLEVFAKEFPSHKLAAEATFELAELLERSERYAHAMAKYAEFAKKYALNVDRSMYALAKAAAVKSQRINKNIGFRELEDLRKHLTAKNAPEAFDAREIVAKSLFAHQDRTFVEFKNAKIGGGRGIEKQVKTKQGILEKLAAGYQNIVGLGNGEYTVASLYRLGEAHDEFASALFKAQSPKGASQKEIDQFRTEMEKVAFPLRDEAYKFFEAAFKSSQEVETFTVWTKRAYQKMVELTPEKHPNINEISADPMYLGHKVNVDGKTAELITQ